MEIKLVPHGKDDVLKVCLVGRLDETESIAFADRLLNAVSGRLASTVALDFSGCEHVCTSGIGALVSFSLTPELEGHEILICGQSSELEEKMKNFKLDRLFRFAPVGTPTQSTTDPDNAGSP